MSLETILQSLKATTLPPAYIAAWQAQGVTVNPNGTVVMQDGSTGTVDPKTGLITLSDGSSVGLANAPTLDNTNTTVTSTGAPIDITLIGEQIKAKAKWTVIGGVGAAAVGAGLGFAVAGPIGARFGALLVGSLGVILGFTES